jgi:hypothetical protein
MLTPQPSPLPGESSIVGFLIRTDLWTWVRDLNGRDSVVELLMLRREQGVARYGAELMSHNGRHAGCDLLQELVDALIYACQDWLETYGEAAPAKHARMVKLWNMIADLARELTEADAPSASADESLREISAVAFEEGGG